MRKRTVNAMDYQSSSTKQEVLKILKVEKRLTVSELAKRLAISEMAVRRHLHTLERDGLVRTTLVRQAMGRPTNVYELSEKGEELFPQNYKQMALELLKDLEVVAGKETVETLFRMRMERMKEQYQHDFIGKSFDERVTKLSELQNEQGYMTELRKDEEDFYHLIAHHCPISEVAKDYRSICSCELQLFKQLLNTPEVVLQSCMTKGDDVCHYQIKQPQ
jgi:DeoR family suf operon transcriptional repressor